MQTQEQKDAASERMKKFHADKKAEKDNEQVAQKEALQNLTPEEKAIYQRAASEDKSWEQLLDGGEDINDYSLSADPFLLPEPAQKLRDKHEFAFRWITRSAARLDEVKNKPDVFRWWVVNRTQPRSGMFDSFIDPNNGCVSREDQMLVFKPYKLFERELNYKRGLADQRTNSADVRNKKDEKGGAELVGAKGKSRLNVSGGDISFTGEAEVDAALGNSTQMVSESDMSATE